MAILKVLKAPHPKLKKIAEPVAIIDDSIRKIFADMLETMQAEEGCGLAANQVGISKRMLIVDLTDTNANNMPTGFYPLYMVNPVITKSSTTCLAEKEGCLSLPQQAVIVERPESITIDYLDYNGNVKTLDATGFLARAIQHEIDHLNGILTIDYLSYVKKDKALRELAKISA